MLPNRLQRRDERRNIPVWMLVAGGLAALMVAVFVWVWLGMGTPPAPETITVDVPLSQ